MALSLELVVSFSLDGWVLDLHVIHIRCSCDRCCFQIFMLFIVEISVWYGLVGVLDALWGVCLVWWLSELAWLMDSFLTGFLVFGLVYLESYV